MIPAPFDYQAPATLEEAVSLLASDLDNAKILAGGHSLIPAMKLRLAQPQLLVDIARIKSLAYIREEGDRILIGATTTHYQLESSDLLKQICPLLPECAKSIGDVQVRNKGTIGGSVAHSDPAGDWPAAVLALGAELVEMPRNRDNALCCGAGGGRIWMKELKGEDSPRPSELRIDEAVELGGIDYFVVACPKDVTMYEDAIKTSGHQGELELRELSELVYESLALA